MRPYVRPVLDGIERQFRTNPAAQPIGNGRRRLRESSRSGLPRRRASVSSFRVQFVARLVQGYTAVSVVSSRADRVGQRSDGRRTLSTTELAEGHHADGDEEQTERDAAE